MHGEFDYNKMPLAPLGCAAQIHESPNRQKTWNVHSLNGWYLGTSDKHYWCYTIYCAKTRSKRISDTVFFQHKYLTQPVVTPVDTMIKAMSDLRSALRKQANTVGTAEMEVLKQLDTILTVPKDNISKHVTFAPSTAPEKLVAPMPEWDAPSPRVAGAFPRVISAAIDKPYGPPQPMMMQARARAQEAELNTQCQSIRNRNCKTDFQAAMNIMEHNIMSETAHAIFDEESGKMLKYRQLITHPKY